MFEKGYAFNDELATTIAIPLHKWLKEWAGCCKTRVCIEPTAKEKKGGAPKGFGRVVSVVWNQLKI